MPNAWFKFYAADYLSDPKIFRLTAEERSCFITILCLANQEDKNGNIDYLDEKMLIAQAGILPNTNEWRKTKGVLKKLESLNIVTLGNGSVTVKNWHKRQASESYERVKKYRLKQKSNKNETKGNGQIREEKIREEKNNTPLTPPRGKEWFETFWKIYPKKVGKAVAQRKFLTLVKNQELADRIFAAVEKQKQLAQWKKDSGQFIPHPATWLNQGRWEDEISTKKQGLTVEI